jgi:hypothetical protein
MAVTHDHGLDDAVAQWSASDADSDDVHFKAWYGRLGRSTLQRCAPCQSNRLSGSDGRRLRRLTTRNRGIVGHRQHQPLCEDRRRPAAERKTEVVDDAVEPARASRRWRQHPFRKALREDLPPAQNRVAAKAASDYDELDHPPRQWKVPDPAAVVAMNAARNGAARRTNTNTL